MDLLPFVACPKTSVPNDELRDAWRPDLNDDRKVDSNDIEALKPHLGSRLATELQPGDEKFAPRMDLNADFKIDSLDMDILKSFLGKSCE